MKRVATLLSTILALVAAIAICASTTSLAQDVALPDAATILAKHVDVTGGRAAYDKIRNRVMKGTMEMPAQGISLAMTVYIAKPDLSYSLIESDLIGKAEKGTNGGVGWEKSMMAGPRILEGDELALQLQGAKLDMLAYWKENFSSYETVGAEDVKGRPCYKVHLTSNAGIDQTVYFDQETGLVVKSALEAKTPMGNIPVETYADDYRKVDGLLLAHKGVVSMVGTERVITMDFEHNVELPDDLFDLPDDIKALLEKQPATE
jgi:hypothetical protein